VKPLLNRGFTRHTTRNFGLENIQDVLGHSSPQVTKMIYIDVADKIPRDAVERLGYLFDEGPEQ
jgi:integrase